MASSNITQIDLKIDQDWSKIINIYNNIINLWKTDSLHNQIYLDGLNTYQFDLGVLGSLTTLDNISVEPKTVSFLHGNIVESNLPWIEKLKSDLQELNISAICISKSDNDVLSHVDHSNNSMAPTDICKLNYVMNNSNSVVCVANNNGEDSIPALKDTALLMDVSYHHRAISNNNPLYLFQICFYKPYCEVVEWFQSHPNLLYSS